MHFNPGGREPVLPAPQTAQRPSLRRSLAPQPPSEIGRGRACRARPASSSAPRLRSCADYSARKFTTGPSSGHGPLIARRRLARGATRLGHWPRRSGRRVSSPPCTGPAHATAVASACTLPVLSIEAVHRVAERAPAPSPPSRGVTVLRATPVGQTPARPTRPLTTEETRVQARPPRAARAAAEPPAGAAVATSCRRS